MFQPKFLIKIMNFSQFKWKKKVKSLLKCHLTIREILIN